MIPAHEVRPGDPTNRLSIAIVVGFVGTLVGCGGETASPTDLEPNPLPVLLALAPDSIAVGTADATITVTGSGFIEASRVRVDGNDRQTEFQNGGELRLTLLPQDVAADGVRRVIVVNGTPGGGTSGESVLTVVYPTPALTSVSPSAAPAGSPGLQVTLSGSGFFGAVSEAFWVDANDTTPLGTTFVDESSLSATIPAELMADGALTAIFVRNDEGPAGRSNGINFSVENLVPVLRSVAPTAVTRASASSLTLTGDNFVESSVVVIGGNEHPASLINDSSLFASLPGTAFSTADEVSVAVKNPAPGGGTSNQLVVAIVDPPPSIALQAIDLVASPSGDVVYAVAGSSDPSFGNRVVALDPLTPAVLWSAPAGSEPQRVVISDDGAFLYVSQGGAQSVLRINIDTRASDLTIPLPTGQRAEDLVVLPGLPTSLAVSLRNTCCSPRHEGVALFDGDVKRPMMTQDHTGSNRIEPSANAERIYGLNNETTEFGFRHILVEADGLRQESVFGGLTQGFGIDIVYDGGMVFVTNGQVLDPEPGTILGTFPASGVMRPDVANARVYFLEDGVLTAYDANSFTALDSFAVEGTDFATVMVRFGEDGMAFGGGEGVVFLRSPLVSP